MKIKTISKNNNKLKLFNQSEWPNANIENYGHSKDWNAKNFVFAVIDESKNIVGTLGMKVEGGVGYIGTMLVAKKHRNKGIGKLLMNHARNIAKEQNAHKIFLQTGLNWPSVNFYRKLGYKITGKLKDHYFHLDFIELSLFL